jgi:hypothetical protein
MQNLERDRGVTVIDLMGNDSDDNIIVVARTTPPTNKIKEPTKADLNVILPLPTLQIIQIEPNKEPPRCKNHKKKKSISH